MSTAEAQRITNCICKHMSRNVHAWTHVAAAELGLGDKERDISCMQCSMTRSEWLKEARLRVCLGKHHLSPVQALGAGQS